MGKKYVNPYEYIHTVVPGCKTSVCKIKPVSRSFFKMIEIMKTMRLIDDKENMFWTLIFELADLVKAVD